jgi:hypothetical protein
MMLTNIKATTVVILTLLIVTGAASAWAGEGQKASIEKERQLLAVLRSGAAAAEKAVACKRLAIDGSSAAVPDLKRLLSDEQLASWARIALEAIPGAEADEALRTAAGSLQGKLLVGTINSIGVRRDAKAVDPLIARLQDKDAEVASAAAVALGHIGNSDAATALRGSLAIDPIKVRSAVAEGCILCAERLHSAGKSAEAVEIYDEVRRADVPKPRILEATRGAILARNQQGIPLLIEQFQSPDKGLFQLALSTAREFPGGEVDHSLAAELARATPQRAALIIDAMADRPETVVVSAVVKAAERGPKQVRIAAIGALGRVGDASCLAALLETAIDADVDLAQAAKETLTELPGEKVDSQIVALLPTAEGKAYPLLIELVGRRRIEATPALLKALDHSDKAVRAAALTSLGETVGPDGLSTLVSQVVAPEHPEDAAVAEKALKAASVRMPDREACAAELAAAVERTSSVPTKSSLLQILAAVGGAKALASVGAAAKSSDAQLQDIASRLLGEWTTEDAAPVLLDLAKTAPAERFQTRALRGYIRIARQFVLSDEERAEMCQKAFEAARQTSEQKLVLEVLKRYPSKEMLKLAIKAMSIAQLKDDATAATLVIAQKLGGMGIDTKELLSHAGFEKVNVEIVKAEYGAGSAKQDVSAVLQKQTTDLPLIVLRSGYNASFGGDPTPGKAKQLKIVYRINGKPGEASFAEDAVIILPMPK